jgi:hypothetical protein
MSMPGTSESGERRKVITLPDAGKLKYKTLEEFKVHLKPNQLSSRACLTIFSTTLVLLGPCTPTSTPIVT